MWTAAWGLPGALAKPEESWPGSARPSMAPLQQWWQRPPAAGPHCHSVTAVNCSGAVGVTGTTGERWAASYGALSLGCQYHITGLMPGLREVSGNSGHRPFHLLCHGKTYSSHSGTPVLAGPKVTGSQSLASTSVFATGLLYLQLQRWQEF